MPGSGVAEAGRLQVEDRENSLRVGEERAVGRGGGCLGPGLGARVDACVS